MNIFLIAVIGGLALILYSNVQPTKMFGPWINGNSTEGIPILKYVKRADGAMIYVALQVIPSQGNFVKIVASTGESWYYLGDLTTFDVTQLASYNQVPVGMYMVG